MKKKQAFWLSASLLLALTAQKQFQPSAVYAQDATEGQESSSAQVNSSQDTQNQTNSQASGASQASAATNQSVGEQAGGQTQGQERGQDQVQGQSGRLSASKEASGQDGVFLSTGQFSASNQASANNKANSNDQADSNNQASSDNRDKADAQKARDKDYVDTTGKPTDVIIANRSHYSIDSLPWGQAGYQYLGDASAYNGQEVSILEEQGDYALIAKDNHKIGWVDKQALLSRRRVANRQAVIQTRGQGFSLDSLP